MVNVLISGNNVTAMIDGKMYLRQDLPADKLKELHALVVSFYEKETKEKKDKILALVSFEIQNKVQEIKKIEEEVEATTKEQKYVQTKIEGFDFLLKENSLPELFVVKNKLVFLKGLESVSMPNNLVNKIYQCVTNGEDITSYLNFWKLCLMNPNRKAREGLFKYVQRQNLLVTSRGYIVCYRKSKKLSGEKNPLNDYVAKELIRLQQSKLPLKRYTIGELNGEYFCLDHRTKRYTDFTGIDHGTIDELIAKLQSEKSEIFTDAHTGKMRFSLGDVVRQDRTDCNEDPNVECSKGLHVGTPTYINGNSCGDTFMLVFVNPMHVVSVPYSDAHKMRVCEYFFSAVLSSMKDVIDIDQSKITVFEDAYGDYEMAELERELSKKVFEEETFQDEDNKKEFVSKKKELKKKKKDLTTKKLALEQSLDLLKDGLSFSHDIVAKDLSLEEVRSIVKSRIRR